MGINPDVNDHSRAERPTHEAASRPAALRWRPIAAVFGALLALCTALPAQEPEEEPSEDDNPARKRLEAARQRMKEAQEKLDEAEREGAVEKQEEAIRELEQAKAELEEILRQLREEEIVRMLAMLEARFQKMLLMQREVHEGTLRLDAVDEGCRRFAEELVRRPR